MSASETVYLLHGLCRTSPSMWLLGRRLRRAGYRTHLFSYLSFRGTVQRHAGKLRQFIDSQQQRHGDTRFHLVGHSLGALVSRYYACHFASAQLQRLVMLAPPNKPATLANRLQHHWFYRAITGAAGQQLADTEFYQQAFPSCQHEVGVIAGRRKRHEGAARMPSGGDDYIVTVEETKFEEMKDWIAICSGHTFIMYRRDTFELVLHFLKHGNFSAANF